jgi:hypothetical protein
MLRGEKSVFSALSRGPWVGAIPYYGTFPALIFCSRTCYLKIEWSCALR